MFAFLDVAWNRLRRDSGDTLLQNARRRFLTFTAALTILIATIWIALTGASVIEGRPFVAILCGLVPLVFTPFPYFALRTNVSLDLLSHAYLITLYGAVTLTVGALGGVVSTTSFFLMLLPLLGTLLFGIRVGLIWVAIVVATYAGLHVLRDALPPSTYEVMGDPPNDWMRMQEVSFWNASMLTLLSLAGACSVANFRAIVGKSSDLLAEAARQTEDAKAAQTAAEDLARSKAQFMSNVSHELRTPLNAVIGYSEMLIESAEERGADEDAGDGRRVLEAALKLRGMVNDILKLAAIDTGKLAVDTEECHPAHLAAEAIEFIEPLLQSKQNRIVFEDATEPGAWLTDSEKLGVCIRNLLANAAHCTDRGEIVLRLAHDKARSHLLVELEDSGPRIAPEQVDSLFEPFAQPGMAGARHYEGMALNLALTRRLARLLGGELSVRSDAATRGASFHLNIPANFIGAGPRSS